MIRLTHFIGTTSACAVCILLGAASAAPALATSELSIWHHDNHKRGGGAAIPKVNPSRVQKSVKSAIKSTPHQDASSPKDADDVDPARAADEATRQPTTAPPLADPTTRSALAIPTPARPAPRALVPQAPPKPGLPTSDVRPPQYVMLAFDGSQSAEMWRQTMALGDDLAATGKRAKFTYFVSGVYFLSEKSRHLYDAPNHGRGRSWIGFGSARNDDIPERIAMLNTAFAKGHEIASHANGHFNGKTWNEADWQSEFKQFNQFLFNAAKNNDLPVDETTGLAPALTFKPRDIIGFRAPMLAHSPGLWAAMATHGYRYDTSRSNKPDYWPVKYPQGGWDFSLGEIRVPGTGMRTLSMDYNFYILQSGGLPKPLHAARYEEQMYQAYLTYFNENYLGNRAPVHIGHHFAQWNDGAYWRAFQRFARAVCGKPEVRCATYRELADHLDKEKTETIAAWQHGQFPKLQGASGVQLTLGRSLDVTLTLAPVAANEPLVLTIAGSDWRPDQYRVEFEIDGVPQPAAATPSLPLVRSVVGALPEATFGWRIYRRDATAREEAVAWLTHRIAMPGTARESVSPEPLEAVALQTPPAHAHDDDTDHPRLH